MRQPMVHLDRLRERGGTVVVVDPRRYEWEDPEWKGRPWQGAMPPSPVLWAKLPRLAPRLSASTALRDSEP